MYLRTLTLIAALGLAVGCEKSSEPSSSDPGAARATKANTGKASSGDVTVKLVEAGSAPQSPLRLQLEPRSETMTMQMDMSINMKSGGVAMPSAALPGQLMTMKFTIADKVSDDEIKVAFEFTKADVLDRPGVQPQVADAVRTALVGTVGMTGSSIVSSRGFNRDATIAVPDSAPAQVRQMIDGFKQSLSSMTVPFPEEPVGVGAKWDVHQKLTMNGIRIDQVIHVELLERSGNIIKIRNTVEQNAPKQKANPPGMPPGTTMEVQSMTGGGTGEGIIDLTKIVPNMKASAQSDAKMKISAGPQTQDMETTTKIEIVISNE